MSNIFLVSLAYFIFSLPVHVIIIILCLVIAVISKFRKDQPRHINSFIAYIALTIAVEIVAWWYSSHGRNNLIFYNLYSIINITYLTYLLRSFLLSGRAKKILTWVLYLYPLLCILNMTFVQGVSNFNTYTFLPGCIIIVTACIFYFYERIKYPGDNSLLRDPTFWISTGLLFFFTCSLPLNGLLNFISNMPFNFYKTLYFINVILNIILYLLFSISFLCNLIFRKSQ